MGEEGDLSGMVDDPRQADQCMSETADLLGFLETVISRVHRGVV